MAVCYASPRNICRKPQLAMCRGSLHRMHACSRFETTKTSYMIGSKACRSVRKITDSHAAASLKGSCRLPPRPFRAFLQEQNKLNAAASWQLKTDQKIKALNINARFEALKLRRLADIERRQSQLADKLAMEELALQQELLDSRTTPEQRRAELTARARSLAAKREAERQQLAQQLYEQQFRESCDLLRGKESQIATHETQHIQQQQVQPQMLHYNARKVIECSKHTGSV